jgi:tetratricopeptide (TPR) repeat protein
LAGVYALMHRVDEAKALLVAAMIVLPSHPLALARLAWCEMQRGNMARARNLYQAFADLAPQRLPVWIALVRLSIEAQEAAASQVALDQLFQQFETLRDEMPATAVDAFVVQLRCLQIEIWALDDNKSQIEIWLADSKVSIVEDDWVGLVKFYASKNQHADVEQALRHALKDVPKNIPLLSQLAELAQMQGRTQQVIALLLRCIHLNDQVQKSTVSFWIKLSSTCLHGMEAQARKSAEKAVELVAELTVTDELTEQSIKLQTWQARNALAQVESQAQNFTEAEALFNQILEENPYLLTAYKGSVRKKCSRVISMG